MSDLITDAMVEAARQADYLHDPQRMECLNHDGSCCPAFDHNVGDERAHRVRAALEAVAPLIAERAWDEALAASAKWSQDQRYYSEEEVNNPYRIEAGR